MKNLELDNNLILEKLKILEKHLQRLEELKALSQGKFSLPNNFDIAAWNLRSALEAVFDLGAHVSSRIPGNSFGTYKEIALKLGKYGIVPLNFAKQNLEKMAGYRNRLTHFYFEVSSKEMYDIIQNNLGDFEIFMKYIKKLIKKE